MTNIDKVRDGLENIQAKALVGMRCCDVSPHHAAAYQHMGDYACQVLLDLTAHEAEVKELVEALEQIMSLPMYIDENGWATVHLYPGLLREARAILAKVKP